MAEGILILKDMVQSGVAMVNAADKFKHFDYYQAFQEFKDLDESEASELAKDLQMLDLSDDELEAKIEAYAQVGARPLAFVMSLLKIFLPKKP